MSQEPSLTWSPSSSPSPPPDSSPPPHRHSKAQLERFHKLGYSTEQVQKVLHKFGPSLDTDKLLEKLLKIGEAEHAAVRMNVPVTQGEMRAERAPAQALVSGQSAQTQALEESREEEDPFRPIVIDGSNVAMSHGNKEVFSCMGIQLAVNFFLERDINASPCLCRPGGTRSRGPMFPFQINTFCESWRGRSCWSSLRRGALTGNVWRVMTIVTS
ncbi:hypothetical protein WMY93_019156 [Mugilogobius chulae]|uniref:Rege-1 UBA-like domain-containing protein n=1 Tax=Mugilogobius chulae TaxID=88201 RepID=A0AAW0NEJ1_9GOBI